MHSCFKAHDVAPPSSGPPRETPRHSAPALARDHATPSYHHALSHRLFVRGRGSTGAATCCVPTVPNVPRTCYADGASDLPAHRSNPLCAPASQTLDPGVQTTHPSPGSHTSGHCSTVMNVPFRPHSSRVRPSQRVTPARHSSTVSTLPASTLPARDPDPHAVASSATQPRMQAYGVGIGPFLSSAFPRSQRYARLTRTLRISHPYMSRCQVW